MKPKITILLLATVSLLFNVNTANAQTCGTSQVTYSGYTSNFLPKWNTTTGCISNSIIYDSGDRIGFGLTAPASLLHSAGQIRTGIPYGGLGGAAAITGALLFYNSSNTNTVNIQSGATTTSYSMTLPPAQGAASSVLMNNGSGGLDWAQLNVGFWGLTGNTLTGTLPASPAEFIGTVNAADWIIRTNNTEKMRVQSGGNVGIGTAAPTVKAHIYNAVDGTFTGLAIDNRKTYGTGTGTNEVSRLIFSLSEAGATDPLTTVMGYISAGTENESSSLPGFMAFGTRTSGSETEKFRITNAGYIGIGLTNPAFKLDVTGTAGSIAHKSDNTTTWDQTSDARLKTNITAFTDGLNVVKEINPVNYMYNGKAGTETTLQHIGVLAQDIQQVAPYTVGTYMAKLDSTDTLETQLLTFNPHGLFFVLINAVKELDSTNATLAQKDSIKEAKIQALETKDSILTVKSQSQDSIIASLQNQLTQLASLISDCCNNHGNGNGNGRGNLSTSESGDYKSLTTNTTSVELSNKNIVVLNQNVPNPFAEQTTISYYLPDNVSRAQIIFMEQSGKIIKTVDLTEKGKGQLNIFANDLSNGIYTYSLIVDGQIIETKKMVKTK